MVTIKYYSKDEISFDFPEDVKKNKRNLTKEEIAVLNKNLNTSDYEDWRNVLVSDVPDEFDPELIHNSHFTGFVVLGRLKRAQLKYHDLELVTGIYSSSLGNVVTQDDVVINNVKYLRNYRIGNRVILFNIQEMSCTCHAKFGNGWLKEGEPESNRIWIGVGNENEKM